MKGRAAVVTASALAVAATVGAGGTLDDPAGRVARPLPAPAATPAPTPAPTPAATPVPTRLAQPPRARPTAVRPTPPACRPAPLEARAAQVLVLGLPRGLTADHPLARSLPEMGIGGVLLLRHNVEDAGQVTALLDALRSRRHGPLLVATDQEGGRVSAFRSVLGGTPSARQAAALGPAAIRARAAETAARLRALGVTVDFAPVADVAGGPAGGAIGDRSYSPDPATASAAALAAARGLASGGVTPVVKHFPGLGQVAADTHVAAPRVDLPAEALLGDLRPFADAVEAGAPAVMVGHAAYPGLGDDLPASLSPAVYRLLRDMGFQGVAITDSLGMGAVHSRFDYPDAAVRALAAGADALLATDADQAVRMRDAIVAAVRSGRLPEKRLDEAAARVLALAGGDGAAVRALACTEVRLPTLR